MKGQFKDILLHGDTRPLGLFLSWVMLIWAIVLLDPTRNAFAISVAFRPMYTYFPSIEVAELVWGLAYLATGIATHISVFYKNVYTRNILIIGVGLFLYTAFSLMRSGAAAIGPWLHVLFAFGLGWKYVRLNME